MQLDLYRAVEKYGNNFDGSRQSVLYANNSEWILWSIANYGRTPVGAKGL
jgi:hypothetical protein